MADAIEEMIRKLGEGGPAEKRDAANALGDAAQQGLDISGASEALETALSDSDHTVSTGVLGACCCLSPEERPYWNWAAHRQKG
jgi:hypothetical protein